MNGEAQDPQNRKDHMHALNEWLGQEHAKGYRTGVEASYWAADKAWPTALRECQADEILDAIHDLLAEQEKKK